MAFTFNVSIIYWAVVDFLMSLFPLDYVKNENFFFVKTTTETKKQTTRTRNDISVIFHRMKTNYSKSQQWRCNTIMFINVSIWRFVKCPDKGRKCFFSNHDSSSQKLKFKWRLRHIACLVDLQVGIQFVMTSDSKWGVSYLTFNLEIYFLL